jgi:hypothetical protein
MDRRIEQKIREEQLYQVVDRATEKVKQRLCQVEPPVVGAISYGAIGIRPGYLVVWWTFNDRAALEDAEQRGLHDLLRRESLAALAEEGYPAEFLPEISIGFAPADEIAKAGGPWQYFR